MCCTRWAGVTLRYGDGDCVSSVLRGKERDIYIEDPPPHSPANINTHQITHSIHRPKRSVSHRLNTTKGSSNKVLSKLHHYNNAPQSCKTSPRTPTHIPKPRLHPLNANPQKDIQRTTFTTMRFFRNANTACYKYHCKCILRPSNVFCHTTPRLHPCLANTPFSTLPKHLKRDATR